jgi:hypothetical protein
MNNNIGTTAMRNTNVKAKWLAKDRAKHTKGNRT